MPHRDDHDAALARAEALQRELDRERASDGEQSERLLKAEKDLADAKERLVRAEAELDRARAAAKKPGADPSPPASRSEASATPGQARKENPRPWPLLAALGGVCAFCGLIGVCVSSGGQSGEDTSATTAPATPVPIPPADALIDQGLAQLGPDHPLDSISIEYVRSDGTLDPTYGAITLESTLRPEPPPPDDPSRPTGAPTDEHSAFLMMTIASCPSPSWSPSGGWTARDGSCLGAMGGVPVGRPTCSIQAIWARARAEDAPDGLARISAQWSIDVTNVSGRIEHQWMWTFKLHDRPRGIDFSHEFADRECKDAERVKRQGAAR